MRLENGTKICTSLNSALDNVGVRVQARSRAPGGAGLSLSREPMRDQEQRGGAGLS